MGLHGCSHAAPMLKMQLVWYDRAEYNNHDCICMHTHMGLRLDLQPPQPSSCLLSFVMPIGWKWAMAFWLDEACIVSEWYNTKAEVQAAQGRPFTPCIWLIRKAVYFEAAASMPAIYAGDDSTSMSSSLPGSPVLPLLER